MTQPPTIPVEQAAEAHARHIVAGDRVALHQDCAVQVLQEPPDLYAQMGAVTFELRRNPDESFLFSRRYDAVSKGTKLFTQFLEREWIFRVTLRILDRCREGFTVLHCRNYASRPFLGIILSDWHILDKMNATHHLTDVRSMDTLEFL